MPDLPVASADRRVGAFVLDRLVVAAAAVGAAWAAHALGGSGAWLVAVLVGAAVLAEVLAALAVGRWGASPGKALCGLRVLSVPGGGHLGAERALVRAAAVAAATLLTGGLGAAALARTAAADPSGRRRGRHDLQVGSVVVDVRSRPVVAEPVAEPPRPLVNLTALRLVPAPAAPPPVAPRTHGPDRAPVPARWRVTFDTGERIEVGGLTLVGRRPEPRPGERPERRLALRSDDQSLSGTHAQFQVVPDGALVVMDRGSTSGSVLLRAGTVRRLTGGRPTTLRDGDRVRFGDREMTVARVG